MLIFCSFRKEHAMHGLNDHVIEAESHRISGATWMCSLFCLVILMLPVIVVEYYFALHAISCQHDMYFTTLTTWLIVDASFQTFILVLLGAIMTTPSRDIWMFLLKPFQIGCVITWTVVGGVLFFKHLLLHSNCDNNIITFMFIRLIGGFISISKLIFT